jgi:hypothetical protein
VAYVGGDVHLDSIAVGSFDSKIQWSRCGNDMFQNRDRKQDSSKMRKIDPRSRICTDMQLIRLNKMWLPCGDASNWYIADLSIVLVAGLTQDLYAGPIIDIISIHGIGYWS